MASFCGSFLRRSFNCTASPKPDQFLAQDPFCFGFRSLETQFPGMHLEPGFLTGLSQSLEEVLSIDIMLRRKRKGYRREAGPRQKGSRGDAEEQDGQDSGLQCAGSLAL